MRRSPIKRNNKQPAAKSQSKGGSRKRKEISPPSNASSKSKKKSPRDIFSDQNDDEDDNRETIEGSKGSKNKNSKKSKETNDRHQVNIPKYKILFLDFESNLIISRKTRTMIVETSVMKKDWLRSHQHL